MKWLQFGLILFTFNLALAQEKKEVESYGYSDEVRVEGDVVFFSNYFSEHVLAGDLLFRTEMKQSVIASGFETKVLIELPILLKYQVIEKVSILFGPKVDLLRTNSGTEMQVLGTIGVQYDATENLQFDARLNLRMTEEMPGLKNHFTSGSISNFTLGSRFKF